MAHDPEVPVRSTGGAAVHHRPVVALPCLQNPSDRRTGDIRAAARERCEIACFASADHWPSVSPPGGSDQGSKIGS